MSKKELMKGNEALAEASIIAGCRYYFGYPITPQNEVPAYMSKRLPEVGGVFVQAESELASINMVYGAAATGVRAMTSSSSPGISLMQEGLSYMAGCEMPALIVNVMRGGPGLGNIAPSQADYLQSVKGGGHGDYHLIVLSPSSVQEIVDLTILAFDYAFKYRNPAMLMFDGILRQMSEPVVLPQFKEIKSDYEWALGQGKKQNIIRSLFLVPENKLELHNLHLQGKYQQIKNEINLYETYLCDDAEYFFVAYGTPSRVCRASIEVLRNKGVKIGLFRPISLWPFPDNSLKKTVGNANKIFVVEMAYNQLEQDVALSIENKDKIVRFNKLGGAIFTEEEIINFVIKNV
ncbi:MAG TPA: 3-methyl-2-oxobutanoate dehydrogenase subunit VorB [Spirochaetota bacterium]|nr:3-methyl-2-oxobutanoate dehydrogenase subunit VorB [Spirochaetota bacterium]